MTQLKVFKFVTTLALVFKKIESKNKTKYNTFYSSSEAEVIINKSDIDDVFQSIYTTIISNIQKYLGKGSGWIIGSVIDHTISISKYNPLAGSSYIKLPKKLDHPRKDLINIQNTDDNQFFKWCLVRYVNPADHNPRRITKTDKDFAKRLDFKDINFQSKLETFPNSKKRIPLSLAFLVRKIRKISNLCIKKMLRRKTCLLIVNRRRRKNPLCSYQWFQ